MAQFAREGMRERPPAGTRPGTREGTGKGTAPPGAGPTAGPARGGSRPASVDVVLPCLDEAAALPWVLERIPDGWRAIVVDNGSTDGSAEIARGLGATVVQEPLRGFGAAAHAGLLAADADIVCFCDCDASLDPALLDPFVRAVRDGQSDLVLGRRRPQGRGAWPPHARAGNLVLARMLRRRTGLRLRDLGPLRAARRAALLDLDLTDRRSGYPLQMVVRAADAGWRIEERDVPYRPRTGRSKVTGTWRGTWYAVRDMRGVLNQPPLTARVPETVPR
ncbi:glycosyltransferase family 2 protein [Streptomyces sp. NPDC093707]|uniref:glycosyltransferase family 2 protein n=1 Tax=Streptomyces sp. NPDC093707 TaxID=3154984 RepID=UPI00344FB821